mmetsp:Transcript_12500/g.20790  ORF Transcript_12500/g.20790 Transcript_12500/m.20790 type:complete len:314 (-) Transcript_12500:258-1199(-)
MGACSSRNDAWDTGILDGTRVVAGGNSSINNGDGSTANAASNNAVTTVDRPHANHHHHLPNFLLELDASDHARARPRRRLRGEHRGLMMRGGGLRHHGRSNNRYDDEVRLAEIMALQQSLAAMEDFFQSLLGQANFYMDAFDPQNSGGNRGPPPVSKKALEELPDITKESIHGEILCGICGEEAAETRLPCGHAFHKGSCVEPWLSRHCTCPVCRYELPTDDEAYEPGRKERMSSRKIELQPLVIETVQENKTDIMYPIESTENVDEQKKQGALSMIKKLEIEEIAFEEIRDLDEQEAQPAIKELEADSIAEN